MTPEQLRGSILQYAVQGKIVEQRQDEGTADDFLNKITEVKSEKIKKGEAKKSKTLTPIEDSDKLFDIPETWKWIKLGEIASLITKGTTPRGGSVAYLDEGIGFLRAENVAGLDRLDKDNLKYIDEDTHNGFLKRSIIETNDILITIAGTLGRTGLVRQEDLPLNANQAVSMVRLAAPEYLDLQYLIYVLNSPDIQKYLTQQKKTTAIPNLTLEIIENCVCPFPPLEEQHRIVAKIEELLPYVDRYAEAYEKLEQFNTKFPEDMKKSILQYAIQGKLVEQRPEEGTAEELYQQIQEEKQSLIKEGKFKKEKPVADILDDEIPYDIPESWKWVRVGDIFNVGTGMTPIKSEPRFYSNGTIPWVNSSLTSNRYVEHVDTLVTQYALDNTSLRLYPAHTLIVAMYGQGKTRGQITELLISATTNQACAALESYNYREATTKYVYYCFLFNYEKLREKAEGTSQPNLNVQKIKETIIPLPPFEEQKRIVSKIEQLLPYCNQLIK